MYVKWSLDQYTRDNVSKIEKKEKIQESSLHPSKNMSTPPKKISYTNPPPMSISTLISKLLSLFVTSDKGVSTSSRHLIIIGQASIIVLITIIIKVTTSSETSREGEGDSMKPSRQAYHRAIRPTWVFT